MRTKTHISVVSRRNAFIAISVPLSLVYESVTDEFTDSTNPISKTNSAWICHIQLKLWLFCDIFAYSGQNLVAMAKSLGPVQTEMSSLDWLTTKPPVISNRILVISRRNAFICIYSNFRPKIGCHGNAPFPSCTGLAQMKSPMVQTLS